MISGGSAANRSAIAWYLSFAKDGSNQTFDVETDRCGRETEGKVGAPPRHWALVSSYRNTPIR
jgi:hypothetical protein